MDLILNFKKYLDDFSKRKFKSLNDYQDVIKFLFFLIVLEIKNGEEFYIEDVGKFFVKEFVKNGKIFKFFRFKSDKLLKKLLEREDLNFDNIQKIANSLKYKKSDLIVLDKKFFEVYD